MTTEVFTLSCGQTVALVFGGVHTAQGCTHHASYFTRARMGFGFDFESSSQAKLYHSNKANYASQLAREVWGLGLTFDAVLMAPSSRQDALVYKTEILKQPIATDLTLAFSHNGLVKSATQGTTVSALCGSLSYIPNGNESSILNLLIIDDSIKSGNTIEAILHNLYLAGLPKTCNVTVAVWAKIT